MSTKTLVSRISDGKNRLSLEDVQIPDLQPHEVLIRVSAAAQNPTDVKSLDSARYGDGAMLGNDICGLVEHVGAEVSQLKAGDRVGAFLPQARPRYPGAYSEHAVAEQQFCFKVPEAMSSESAATLPLALTTAWLAFFSPHSLGIDRARGEQVQILIWGGSSSVGQYAIQIARHFGFQVATTCTNREVVEALGVKHVFSYRSPSVVEDIKKTLPGITYVFDCIGNANSSAQASSAVCDAGGVLCTVQPGKRNTEDVVPRVKVTDVMVFTSFFKEIRAGKFHVPARKEDRDLAHELYRLLPEMLSDGSIKPNPVHVVEGGLNGVPRGFQLYRDGAISGQKLVYKIR